MKYNELQRKCNKENISLGASEMLSDFNYLNSFRNSDKCCFLSFTAILFKFKYDMLFLFHLSCFIIHD